MADNVLDMYEPEAGETLPPLEFIRLRMQQTQIDITNITCDLNKEIFDQAVRARFPSLRDIDDVDFTESQMKLDELKLLTERLRNDMKMEKILEEVEERERQAHSFD